jgi:LuxR family maltose regulon positive regulatory protein
MSQYRGIMFKKNREKPVKLSPRQLEILEYLYQNLTYNEISAKLGIKFTTVNDHVTKLYEKLEVSNAREAVSKAKELGIVK